MSIPSESPLLPNWIEPLVIEIKNFKDATHDGILNYFQPDMSQPATDSYHCVKVQ